MIRRRKGFPYRSLTPTFTIPKDASRDDLLVAIEAWKGGGSVTGHHVLALYRYWKGDGPEFSQHGLTQYERVRRILESRAVVPPGDDPQEDVA